MTSHEGIQTNAPHQQPEHQHHDAHAPVEIPFTDAEIETFRKEDIHAGKAVVLLMTGIFSMGVLLYTLVMLTTWPAINHVAG